VTFTATDDCGNATTTSATITIEDTTAPSMDVAASDETVECDGAGNSDALNAWLDAHGGASASDLCSDVSWSHDFEALSDDCGLTGSATVTFTATDACGNATTTSATFTIEDTTGPELSVPADYTAECTDDLVFDEASAVDGCQNCMDEYSYASSAEGYGLSFELVAEHSEGELAGMQTYRVYLDLSDAADRVTSFTGDDVYALELATTTSFYQHALGSATPNGISEAAVAAVPELAFDSYVTIGLSGAPQGDQTGVELIPGAWSEAFEAGQSILVNDGIGSGWYVLPDSPNGLAGDDKQLLVAQLTTDGEISGQFRTQIFPMGDQENDIRAELSFSHDRTCTSISEVQETVPGDAAGNYTIVRTFTATDLCGNETVASQTITVVDTTAPEFTFVPADYTVECSDDMPMDDATATDACGTTSVTVTSETVEGDAAGNYTIVRTFTATDDAGNSSTAVQTITVQDTTAPEFTSVPADYTVECSDDMPMDDATASDNCGEVTISVSSETTAGDAAGNYTIVRTFTATDDAGNSTTASQTITVVDTTAPEFTFVPADASSECGEAWSTEMATATDNCGEVTVTVEETTADGDCAGLLVITRTFTATDDAGNSTSAVQTITQVDTTAPTLTVAADVTIECTEAVPAPSSEATDSCSDVEVTVSMEVVPGDCAQESTIVRTYTAVDGCGNETTAVQNVYVVDTTAPEFTETEPLSLTVFEFDGDTIPEPSATVVDACDANASWTVEETVLENLPNELVIQRVYTATDDCGNVATYTSTVSFVPVVEGCTDADACNYNLYANLDDESCFFALPGYDCDGNCLADANDNGICDDLEIAGCTDPTNPGYNPAANVDDGSCLVGGCTNTSACNYDENADYQVAGSCEFTSCAGCMNVNACNYDPTATLNNGSCVFAVYGYDCDGNCLLDDDGDGICNQFEVPGCTDPTNPAYNPNATDDNGSCLTGGCTFFYACNYDPDADFLDILSCDFQTCAGCTDEDACNYDPTATLNVPSSCDFPESIFVGCDGLCFNDADGDGICDEEEIPGCTDPSASNYSPFATDDNGTCITEVGGCILPFACNYDPSADFYLPGSCDFSCLNGMPSNEGDCTDELACNYGVEGPCVYFDEEGQLCATVGCTNELACNYDPEAQINSGCDYTSCLVYGCTNANACNYDVEATTENGSCNYTSCVGCTDAGASNFDPEATIDNGQCQYDIYGCMTMMACNYNPEATVNDGTCDFASCFGCVTPTACNYDEDALYPDGSCLFAPAGLDCDGNCLADLDGDMVCDADEVSGCTDEGAVNYNPAATDDNGSCEYLTTGCTDQTACNFDYNAQVDNGSCDFDTCSGCIVPWACNYDEAATLNDGSCVFPDATGVCPSDCVSDIDGDGICDANEVEGCTYANALNFDAAATNDDGTCVFSGCTLSDFSSYNEYANHNDGDCTNAPASADFNGDGMVQLEDLLEFLVAFGSNGPEWGLDWVNEGCNVVAMGIAEFDVSDTGCTYPTASNYDADADSDAGTCVWLGCTDEAAYNYNHLATLDDSSCTYSVCPDFNGDGQVQTSDLLDFLVAWGTIYE
jgi:predicted nucleic acid-binding Zn ribbon protein